MNLKYKAKNIKFSEVISYKWLYCKRNVLYYEKKENRNNMIKS